MAKALYGHMAAADPRLLSEVSRLRARVAELEAEVESLNARVAQSELVSEISDASLASDVYLDRMDEPAYA